MAYQKSSVSDPGRGKSLAGFEYCHQYSNTPGDVPPTNELKAGELAVNAADGKLFFRKPDGTSGVIPSVAEAPSDSITYGRRNAAWVDITSPANLQVRRGTSGEVTSITPLAGEPVWDTSSKRLFVGDGSTAGGILVGRRTYHWAEVGSAELSRSVGSPASNTADSAAAVTLGPAGTYLVFSAIRFEAEDEENSGASTLKFAWTTASLSYLFGGAEETLSVGSAGQAVGPVVVTRQFLCVSSAAGASLAPSWRVSAGSAVFRQQGYVVAVLL